MQNAVKELENNLRQQTGLYNDINSLEKKKQHALVFNEIREIEQITAQEEKIVLEIGNLEVKRLYWAEFFSKKLGKSMEEITLAEIVQHYPELGTVQAEIEGEVSKLRDIHETNTKLLQNAINMVNFTVRSITLEQKKTYSNPADKSGKNQGEKKRSISFIDKSV
ncbi:MAG: flagellar protein FlgN [Eubacteriales bacterium]